MARRSMGEPGKTYKNKFESAWGFFALSVLGTIGCLTATVAAYFQADTTFVWVCLGVLTLLVAVIAVGGLVTNLASKKVLNRLRFYEHGFIQEDLSAETKEEIYWDDIAAISYQSEGVFAGIAVRTYQNKEIKIYYQPEENVQIYRRLCKETKARLVQEANDALEEKKTLEFGPELKINDAFVWVVLGKVRWKDIETVELYDVYVNNVLSRRDLRFLVRGAWFDRTISRDSMENLHVFLELAKNRFEVECVGTGKLG